MLNDMVPDGTAPLFEDPLDLRVCDLIRAGISSDEIISRLTDEGMPEKQAELTAQRGVQTVIQPEVVRLFQLGWPIMKVQDHLVDSGLPRLDVFSVIDRLQGSTLTSVALRIHPSPDKSRNPSDARFDGCIVVLGVKMFFVGVILTAIGASYEDASLQVIGAIVTMAGFLMPTAIIYLSALKRRSRCRTRT